MHTTMVGGWHGDSAWHTTASGIYTNSRHHQGFHVKDVSRPWETLDWTSDGLVEAIQHGNQFGVQWHPELDEMIGTDALRWWQEKAKEVVYG